eukprot:2169762-Amphidinium_carterae.2
MSPTPRRFTQTQQFSSCTHKTFFLAYRKQSVAIVMCWLTSSYTGMVRHAGAFQLTYVLAG